jgi:hypothetical protein
MSKLLGYYGLGSFYLLEKPSIVELDLHTPYVVME